MHKILIVFILFLSLSQAVSAETKTSELELFLFKVGFESLLKDIESEKLKTGNNSDKIEKLNLKIDYIIEKLNARKISFEGNNNNLNNNSSGELKNEVEALKTNIHVMLQKMKTFESQQKEVSNKFENLKHELYLKKENTKKSEMIQNMRVKTQQAQQIPQSRQTESKDGYIAYIAVNSINVRNKPFTGDVIKSLRRNEQISLDYCDKYGWCKLKDINGYVAKHLIKFK